MIRDLKYDVGLTYLPLATGESDVHETAGVCDSLLRAALGGLLLLLWLNLWVYPSAFVHLFIHQPP